MVFSQNSYRQSRLPEGCTLKMVSKTWSKMDFIGSGMLLKVFHGQNGTKIGQISMNFQGPFRALTDGTG